MTTESTAPQHFYQEFYNSFVSFIDLLTPTEDNDIGVTMVFIEENDDGTLVGRYRYLEGLNTGNITIPKELTSKLEAYNIDLDDESFGISRMYKSFRLLNLGKDALGDWQQTKVPKKLNIPFTLGTTPDEFRETLFTYFKAVIKEVSLKAYVKQEGKGTKAKFLDMEGQMVNQIIANKEDSRFLPIPIISQAELKGAVYLIYDGSKKTKDDKSLENIITDFINTYTLILTEKYESLNLRNALSTYQEKPTNPFIDFDEIIATTKNNSYLTSIGYDRYYDKQKDALIREIQAVYIASIAKIKAAIIAIIVDSFAHNVGAHSLVAVKWWLENRYKKLDEGFSWEDFELSQLLPLKIEKDALQRFAKEELFYSQMSFSESSKTDDQVSLLDIIRHMAKKEKNMLAFYDTTINPETESEKGFVAQLPVPIDFATFPFFEYLRDKSALWSGVTRDTTFSGRIRRWIPFLKDFLSNSIFLGTITHSEGINRVNFHIEILDENNTVIESGEFAKINLDVIEKEKFIRGQRRGKQIKTKDKVWVENNPTTPPESSDYAFLTKGQHYTTLYSLLERLDPLFFPNGLIGQQALYTILENTLRNIKHYKKGIEEIKSSGINFYLSIQEVGFIERMGDGKQTKDKKLFKLGTWLQHPQNLYAHGVPVIQSHAEQLKKRIVDELGKAQLGGSSQDKVCAAMLMNNTFDSIDKIDPKEVKSHYYPYVFPASESFSSPKKRKKGFQTNDFFLHMTYNTTIRSNKLDLNNQIEALQIPQERIEKVRKRLGSITRNKKFQEEVTRYRKNFPINTEKGIGIIKKFFHVWKGVDVLEIDHEFDYTKENLGRFRVVSVGEYKKNGQHLPFYGDPKNDKNKGAVHDLRLNGVIRIVNNEKGNIQGFDSAMQTWLIGWLKDKQQGVVLHKPEGENRKDPFGAVYMHNDQLVYENKATFENNKAQYPSRYQNFHQFESAHSVATSPNDTGTPQVSIRSHCSFMTNIFEKFKYQTIAKVNELPVPKSAKLLETLLTRIDIFDNRVFERLPQNRQEKSPTDPQDVFSQQLLLNAYQESADDFKKYKAEILNNTHFLIMHLSFLESIDKEPNIKYKEIEVEKFYKKEIESFFIEEHGAVPENFLFVITSGRGRGDWFEAIKHPQITFRPIESLMDVIEDGLSLHDDFQVKYGLCNVLFGS